MTSYERVMNRLAGKPVDKIPNMNIFMAFAADYIKMPYGKYVTDYRVLVEGRLKMCEDFGVDIVSCISDPMREAHGFGAKVIIPEDGVPYCKEHLIEDLSQIKNLKPVDPFSNERMLDRIRAIELFKTNIKNIIPIEGWVEGALAEAADLRDISTVMMDLIMEPEALTELFEIAYLQQRAFAKAQIEAGADIIGVGNAAASLIGPQLYEEFCLEFDKRIIKDIHDMGAKAKLHICGNTEALLELLIKTEADIFDLDHMVDFGKAVKIFKNSKTSANGNIDPVTGFFRASLEELETAVRQRIEIADEKTFISGGCEIPRGTPYVNLKRMNEMLYL
ncbi:MAG: uroporphyrinogen decarboxylase family protein [Vallitaleaceae bacterium]|nr:uroporphyrinogen decarboxylase family protein [Vallitaleaceae bacterium]